LQVRRTIERRSWHGWDVTSLEPLVGDPKTQSSGAPPSAPLRSTPLAEGDQLNRTPRWAWPVVLVIAGLSGLAYAWGIDEAPLEPYYEAAVRSMSTSWHDFFYGAFDPAGTITLDKLPGAFWLQALSVRIFGFHTWAIVLPQVIAGVLAIIFLFRAVERLMGTWAGVAAAFLLALSPATVALDRGNISDTEMVLFLVLAANSLSAAIVTGRGRSLILAGVWVGVAFQTKMVEAWLVLPAMGLAYVLGSTRPLTLKLRQLLVAGLVTIAVSLAWMTLVTAIPQSSRPYVDGSQHDSLFEQVFVYNGFGRFGNDTPVQELFGQGFGGSGLSELVTGPPPSWNRLFSGDLGRDTGFLLPAALVVGVAGLFTPRRRRSFYVLWTGWLVTLVAVFSFGSTINSYYTAALSPPIAAILGAGAVRLWAALRRPGSSDRRPAVTVGLAAAAIVVGTVAYELWLAYQDGTTAPGWLWTLTIAVGVVAVVLILTSSLPRVGRVLGIAAVVIGTAAIIIVPATGSALLVSEQRGVADTPFESTSTAKTYDLLLAPRMNQPGLAKAFEGLSHGAPYLMAVQSAAVASIFIDATGQEVLPIGGFSGTIPSPTLQQLESDIRAGKFHVVLTLGTSHDPRLVWIRTHCRSLGAIAICTPADAPPA
jgi:4-amino-4-deoxy-L-arabinose transferase-like glycosyltransferase